MFFTNAPENKKEGEKKKESIYQYVLSVLPKIGPSHRHGPVCMCPAFHHRVSPLVTEKWNFTLSRVVGLVDRIIFWE